MVASRAKESISGDKPTPTIVRVPLGMRPRSSDSAIGTESIRPVRRAGWRHHSPLRARDEDVAPLDVHDPAEELPEACPQRQIVEGSVHRLLILQLPEGASLGRAYQVAAFSDSTL